MGFTLSVFESIEQVLKSDVALAFAGMALLMALVYGVLLSVRPAPETDVRPAPDTDPGEDAPPGPVARMQKTLGVEGLPAAVFVLAGAVWLVILASLLAGLLMLIWTVILHAVPGAAGVAPPAPPPASDAAGSLPAPPPVADGTAAPTAPALPAPPVADSAGAPAEGTPPAPPPGAESTGGPTDPTRATVWDYRFLLAQLAAITTVLGAVVAFPVTLSRLRLASEDKDTRAAALYNDKVNAALSDLHAQRQVTAWKRRQGHVAVWEDDIVRRNGAIDRLESLAIEERDEAPRIARMLATYLRELSEVHPPKDPPPGATPDELRAWGERLRRARSDMENAAQTLGRLRDLTHHSRETLPIDLHGANLQGMDLQGAGLEKADLSKARMEGANLSWARMQGAKLYRARMQGANLGGARMQGANLGGARMQGANLWEARMQGADLRVARMQGATLIEARLEGATLIEARLEGADLSGARMQGADLWEATFDRSTDFSAADTTRAALKSVDLTNIALTDTQLQSMFGDGSVTLPEARRPAHWPGADLDWDDFDEEWRLWQQDPAGYVRPEDRPA